jgi:hypothetical protein
MHIEDSNLKDFHLKKYIKNNINYILKPHLNLNLNF